MAAAQALYGRGGPTREMNITVFRFPNLFLGFRGDLNAFFHDEWQWITPFAEKNTDLTSPENRFWNTAFIKFSVPAAVATY